MSWMIDNLGTIVVGLLLAAVVIAIIIRQIKNKKAGSHSCGSGCQCCALAGTCHLADDKKTEKMADDIIRRIRKQKEADRPITSKDI